MIDFLAAIESESDRFHAVISATPMANQVPSCPDWLLADLAWHLTDVQYFWASIVDGLLDDPAKVTDLERPEAEALPALFQEQSQFMLDALTRRDPDDGCWSWHDLGRTVGWIRRRQAHEALIHRVDAELAAGLPSEIDPALAADGVDEVLRVMLDLDNLPDWAVFDLDGTSARIDLDDGSASWSLEMGRFKGTSPTTGTAHDFPALTLIDRRDEPSVVLRGPAAALNLWLWGRGPLDPITVEGDPAVAANLRAAAADGTR